MKVEFWSSPERGAELLIPATEFSKAQKNENEFQSLVHATEAFALLFGIDYKISEREYEVVSQKLEKSGIVILSFTSDGGTFLEVSNSNHHTEKVAADGHIIGHFDPNVAKRIQARYEKGAKRK